MEFDLGGLAARSGEAAAVLSKSLRPVRDLALGYPDPTRPALSRHPPSPVPSLLADFPHPPPALEVSQCHPGDHFQLFFYLTRFVAGLEPGPLAPPEACPRGRSPA